jgi:hypothetical protein
MIGMFRGWRWLIGLIILGLFLRLVAFGRVPVSPYWDEMAIWADARSIVETGRDLHDRVWFQPLFISYGDFKLPVYIWLTALSSLVFNEIFPAVRFPSLLAGLSMIPGVYLLLRFLQPKEKSLLPLLGAGTVAIMPWSLHFSQVGFEGHVGAAFLLWSVVALWSSLRAQSTKPQLVRIILSALLGTAAVYTYFSVRFVWPVVWLAPLVLWFPQFRRRFWQFAIGLAIWGLLLIPMYRADFYQASNQFRLSAANILNQPGQPDEINLWRQRSGNTIVSRLVFNRYTFVTRDLARNYWAFLDPGYLFLTGDPNLRHSSQTTGLLYLSLAPFFILGILSLVRRQPILAAYLGLWWAAGILPAAVPTDVPHALRSLNTLPVFAVLTAFGLQSAWSSLPERKLRRFPLRYWLGALMVGLLSLEVIRWEYGWLKVYPRISDQEWQDGYLPTARYVQSVRDKYTFVYVDQFDERFFLYYLPYSGLTWQEIQRSPSSGFRRTVFRNVIINNINDWETLEHNSLVVTSPSRLPERWLVKDTIFGTAGKEAYVAVETVRD